MADVIDLVFPTINILVGNFDGGNVWVIIKMWAVACC